MNIEDKKIFSDKWFSYLQEQICNSFEKIEIESRSQKKFISTDWYKKSKGGGGTYKILKNGKIFDKVGVNKSTVSGIFSKKFRHNIPGAQKDGKYWASGISVVAHMKNPKIPAIHFNTRFIVTSKNWFGGGIDVTPCFKDKKEEKIFHLLKLFFVIRAFNNIRGILRLFTFKIKFGQISESTNVAISGFQFLKKLLMRNTKS